MVSQMLKDLHYTNRMLSGENSHSVLFYLATNSEFKRQSDVADYSVLLDFSS